MRYSLVGIAGLVLVAVFASLHLQAQNSAGPEAYTVTQVMSMFGPAINQTIYRSGPKVMVDQVSSPTTHTRTLYDLQANTSTSWDVSNASAGCSAGKFSGDWGGPQFATAADLAQQNLKDTGAAETINGFATKVVESSTPQGKIKGWWDPKTGLLVKTEMIPPSGPTVVLAEIKHVSWTAPDASVFALPASCAGVKPPPTEAEIIAADTGGKPDDFTDATLGPGSAKTCSVAFRIFKAGTMEPVTHGFQVGIDTNVDIDHPASYTMGEHTDGTESFSGGGLHEVTSQVRNGVLHIANPPAHFNLLAHITHGSDNQALIYRQCYHPQTVLLMVFSQDATKPNHWLWVKSGKYVTAP